MKNTMLRNFLKIISFLTEWLHSIGSRIRQAGENYQARGDALPLY
jgi:hypothetical protein